MTKRKDKPVYSITAYDAAATAVYSCLKTLCQAWQLMPHYTTIWRRLHTSGEYHYTQGIIKKHNLIRSIYKHKN